MSEISSENKIQEVRKLIARLDLQALDLVEYKRIETAQALVTDINITANQAHNRLPHLFGEELQFLPEQLSE